MLDLTIRPVIVTSSSSRPSAYPGATCYDVILSNGHKQGSSCSDWGTETHEQHAQKVANSWNNSDWELTPENISFGYAETSTYPSGTVNDFRVFTLHTPTMPEAKLVTLAEQLSQKLGITVPVPGMKNRKRETVDVLRLAGFTVENRE